MVFDSFGGPEVLHPGHLPIPVPRPDELVIRVAAFSVNPIDTRIRRGELWPVLPRHPPYTVGFDFSGTVSSTARATHGFREGDPVIGLLRPWWRAAAAPYVTAAVSHVVRRPAALSILEAAALPLAGLTAYDALSRRARVRPGDRVLVVGASGGVGTFAVQIARELGAEVTTVTSSRNVALARALGAHHTVAYDEARPTGTYEVVFDVVGTMPYPRARPLLAPAGRYVTIIPSVRNVPSVLLGALAGRPAHIHLLPDVSRLAAVVDMAAAGRIRPEIERVFQLEELAEAHRHSETGRTRGKLVVRVAEP